MEISSSHVRDLLMRESEEFQQLSRRHQELDERLVMLTEKLFLTDEEKVEEVTLKKKKLAIKDRMAHMIRSH
ncbi:MAG TPA: YdcH family protein [Vicinamibacteria bacterium]|nr:YdcH family protein [Vicinamibacteria bacterium]